MKDPTACSTCRGDLERGYSSIYNAKGKLVRTLCLSCARKERRKNWEATGVLTTAFMMDACLEERDRPGEASKQVERLQEDASRFATLVWHNGLREHLASHRERGESLAWRGMKLLTYVMAGRVLLTLEDDAASITLITADDDATSRCGIQGISATEAQARELIELGILAWKLGHRTKPDGEVRIAGT